MREKSEKSRRVNEREDGKREWGERECRMKEIWLKEREEKMSARESER